MNWITDPYQHVDQPPSAHYHPLLTEEGYWESKGSPRLVIYSGAGLSVESGMATFNTDNGLWENHKVEDVCNGFSWKENRELVERFYGQRSADNIKAVPHAGHQWCAGMEAEGAALITQNVDTLLERAGARFVRHIHGRIDQRRCWSCSMEWTTTNQQYRTCPICRSEDTRVNVVFYKEQAPEYARASKTIGGLRPQDVLLIVGTQASVANPLRWLTGPTQVWVVDPQPSARLLAWPGVRAWAEPASRLAETAGVAWHQWQQSKKHG